MTELREIDPPLITRRVRFVPYSAHPKHICMRVELYGCPWTGDDHTISCYGPIQFSGSDMLAVNILNLIR